MNESIVGSSVLSTADRTSGVRRFISEQRHSGIKVGIMVTIASDALSMAELVTFDEPIREKKKKREES